MKFLHTQYIPLYVLSFFIICFCFYKCERNFFRWFNTYWNLKRSWPHRIASWFLIISLCLMMLALLDLRGTPETIESQITDQKTIILIDNSASMLVPDVRPNSLRGPLSWPDILSKICRTSNCTYFIFRYPQENPPLYR